MRPRIWGRRAIAVPFALVAVLAATPLSAQAASFTAISGAGSTAAQSLLDQWRRDVSGTGLTVYYGGTGSTAGRADFAQGTTDFAVSELPFQAQPEDGSPPEAPSRGYTYVPLLAGGTALMYNLEIDGRRVNNLRLSGETVAGVFSGTITRWNDAAIVADNPQLTLPDREITPVVRSDSSGSTAQFTAWLAARYPQIWNAPATSVFPASRLPAAKARAGSLGVTGYVSQSYGAGSLTYVQNAYAQRTGFPVVQLGNAAGAFVSPDAANVEAALRAARTVADTASPPHLTQVLDDVYVNPDPAAYPLSSYSYLIAPTDTSSGFTLAKGDSLRAFLDYALGEGQSKATALGYAPLPANVLATARAQAELIPTEQSASPSIALQAQVIEAHDAQLSLVVPVGEATRLDAPTLVDGRSVSVGELTSFTVVDARALTRPGYTVHSTVSDFSSGASVIPAGALTVTPRLQSGSTAGGVRAAAPFAASGSATVFAEAPAGAGVGTAVLGADLRLSAPRGTAGGTYSAVMTLTVVSR